MMTDGTGKRDSHTSRMRSVPDASSREPGPDRTSWHSQPGILIFSQKRQLLHMNRRALELTGQLQQTEPEPGADVRSAPVHELRAHIQETLNHRKEANIWELFELKRFIFEAGRKILVRGFGLADRSSFNDSRIVIVLEEVGARQEYRPQQASTRPLPSESGCAAS